MLPARLLRSNSAGHGAGQASGAFDTSDPAMFEKAARKALSATNGPIPAAYIGSGGSIPIAGHFQQILGTEPMLVGFGKDDDAIHSPNEKIRHGKLSQRHPVLGAYSGRIELMEGGAVKLPSLLGRGGILGATRAAQPSFVPMPAVSAACGPLAQTHKPRTRSPRRPRGTRCFPAIRQTPSSPRTAKRSARYIQTVQRPRRG